MRTGKFGSHAKLCWKAGHPKKPWNMTKAERAVVDGPVLVVEIDAAAVETAETTTAHLTTATRGANQTSNPKDPDESGSFLCMSKVNLRRW
jgi:hypothetical protein